jgi:hypothetical protein
MNHRCHGEFFTDAGVRKYRCFADSSITAAAVSNCDQCPCCGRKIDGVEKPAFAWAETKWFANCTHCGVQNEVDSDACQSGSEYRHKCLACELDFTFRAGT